ncbi:MAG: hypothetical protein HYV09_37830 [Deltaproteobacteria bacterium]|nr:hypothetical protein [Deltaproteobacteria bacterium]
MACIPREALISALVGRARQGYRVTRADVEPLLRSGVPFEQLLAAFAGDGEGLAHARAVLAQLAGERVRG